MQTDLLCIVNVAVESQSLLVLLVLLVSRQRISEEVKLEFTNSRQMNVVRMQFNDIDVGCTPSFTGPILVDQPNKVRNQIKL